jgi:hypothetical protein
MIHTVKFPSGKQTHALVPGAEHKPFLSLTRSDLVCNPGRGNVATVQASSDEEPTCTRCVKALAMSALVDSQREEQGRPPVNRGYQVPAGGIVQCATCGERFESVKASQAHGHIAASGLTEIRTVGAKVIWPHPEPVALLAASAPSYRIQARRAPGEWLTCTNYDPFATQFAARVQARAAAVLVPDSQWRVIDEPGGTVVWAGPEVTAQVPPAGASLLIGSAGYGTARRERQDGPVSFRAPRGKRKASKRRYGR